MKTNAFRALKCAMPGVHGVEASSTHSFPRHTHDQFGIGLIRSGAQKSMSGRGMVEAGPGMVITVNPGEVHDGLPIGEAGRRWTMLYFDPEALQEIVQVLTGRMPRSNSIIPSSTTAICHAVSRASMAP